MKTSEELRKIADGLKKQYKLDGDNTFSILSGNVGRAFAEFSATIADETDQDQIFLAQKPVKYAIGLANDWLKNERLDQLVTLPRDKALKAFLADQTVIGFGLDKDKEGNWSIVYDRAVSIDFSDLYKRLLPADYDGILDMLAIFADNLAKYVLRDDTANVTRAAMSEHYVALRERIGMTIPQDKLSKHTLADQLTMLVKCIFNQNIEMKNADITFLCAALIQGKSVANNAGSYVMREEKTLLNLVFRAVYTRINQLPYSFQTKTKVEKDPRTVKVDKKNNQPKSDDVKASGDESPVVVAEKVA